MNSVKESQAEKRTHTGEMKNRWAISGQEFWGEKEENGPNVATYSEHLLNDLAKEDLTPLVKVLCYIN